MVNVATIGAKGVLVRRWLTIVLSGCVVALAGGMGGTAAAGTVDKIDFLNYTYPFNGEQVTVRDGEFTRDDPEDSLFFRVLKVVRGDVGLDGSREAVVVTVANTGGTGAFSDGYVYADEARDARLFATLGIGDRADGGIFDVRILSGDLVVERFAQADTGACCPTQINTTRLRRDGKRLSRVGGVSRRAYVYAGFGTRERPARLNFLPGTSVGTAAGDGFSPETIVFDAAAGQRLTIVARRPARLGALARARIDVRVGSRTLVSVRRGERRSVTLPATGTYRLHFRATGDRDRDASIAADVTLT